MPTCLVIKIVVLFKTEYSNLMVVLSVRVNCTVSVTGEEVYPSLTLFLLRFSLIFQTHVIERLLFSHASLFIFLSLGVCQQQLSKVTFLCGYFVLSLYIDEKITLFCVVFLSEIILKCDNQNLIFFARPIKTSTACACDF